LKIVEIDYMAEKPSEKQIDETIDTRGGWPIK